MKRTALIFSFALIWWLFWGWLGVTKVAAGGELVRVIPTFFGQSQSRQSWFVYHTRPGAELTIPLTLVNLSPRELSGHLELKASFIKEEVTLPFKLSPQGREDVTLKLQVNSQTELREYNPSLKVIGKAGEELTKVPLRVVVGDNLQLDYEVTKLQLKPQQQGVNLSFQLKNKGQVSLEGLKVLVKYKNSWWLGLPKEEEFMISKRIPPGAVAQITQTLSPPAGLFGPTHFNLQLQGNKKKVELEQSLFWFPVLMVVKEIGYLVIFLVALGLSFKFIFKGTAGLIYRYLQEKFKKGHPQGHQFNQEVGGNLLVKSSLTEASYAQLLLDIRQIVREEIELHRRLIAAESERTTSQLLINLIKNGQLKLVTAKGKKQTPKKKQTKSSRKTKTSK